MLTVILLDALSLLCSQQTGTVSTADILLSGFKYILFLTTSK